MRTRSIGLALVLVASIAMVAAGCSSNSGASATAAVKDPCANTAGGTPTAQGGPTGLKIGLVTDVGTINDKNFNEYSWKGAQDGATKIGAPAPQSAQSATSADIQKNIQSFVDQHYDIIVTVGFAAGDFTICAAKASPKIKFIGIDQGPCVDANANPDSTFKCAGDPSKLLPNLQGIQWFEQQPGYLAGIVAASISKTGHIAAIGGTASVPAVPNYMVGYLNGAKSVNPDATVLLQYISPAPDTKAFNDPSGGTAFAKQLLSTDPKVDVIFQVAGKTGNGVLQAVCDANLYGIGVDVDQFVSTPTTAKCTVVSAEKKLSKNVLDAIVRISEGKDKGGVVRLGIDTDDVGLSSFHDSASLITPDTQSKIDAAISGMKAGTLVPCVQNASGGCKIDKTGQPAP